ncbi:hypothetical protein DS2_06966 [Catenovulum agarivorans DS-2]|uniref:Succinylglutamate desuccinylase n=1 Tax=Catenovulum agarivorans DS-2 TaxID=1328313 RepID=W7QP61_9ALTE|nr:DUF1826 domain-containing protein [Catenovulum agarivorans]EWH10772.1 hypothetical protein DS2_06966 [Catenovulum agarivorans DS-2]
MTNSAIAYNYPSISKILSAKSQDPSILADIYDPNTNIAIWKHKLEAKITEEIAVIQKLSRLNLVSSVTPDSIKEQLINHSDIFGQTPQFTQHLATVVEMFCTLFDLPRAGMRLNLLTKAMCPKFHVDHIPCRLVSTFSGHATEWLEHSKVNRAKLGAGSHGLTDEQSGIYRHHSDIQQLDVGDVALLKGDGWQGNEGAGLVHRSPTVRTNECRLLLTLDFID